MNFINQISKCEINIVDNINLLKYNELFPIHLLVQGYDMDTYKINTTNNSLKIINNLFSDTSNYYKEAKRITNIKKINMIDYNKQYIEQLNITKKFLESKFKLHKIYTLNKNVKLSSPFNIKISRIKNKTLDGYIETFFSEIEENEFKIVFNEISLPLLISKLLPSIYSHEIIHTQIMNIFGSVNNYFNSEILPIFIEILYKYDNNFLSTYRIQHLHYTTKILSESNELNINTFENMLYYVSIITAYKLFNIYSNGNIFIKNEILNNIQFVFDSEFTVEDLLDKYDLNWAKKRVITK